MTADLALKAEKKRLETENITLAQDLADIKLRVEHCEQRLVDLSQSLVSKDMEVAIMKDENS